MSIHCAYLESKCIEHKPSNIFVMAHGSVMASLVMAKYKVKLGFSEHFGTPKIVHK